MLEPPLLSLQDVRTRIGSYKILHGVSMDVRPGRATMLLGRNGAGKTTTLRTIMGLWRAESGSIMLDGQSLAGLPTSDIARRGIGYVPETMGIFGRLTVRENLLLATGKRGFDEARLQRVLELFPALKVKWSAAAGALSGGQKQMVAIGRALIEERRLLIVDEPTKGLAPAIVDSLVDAFTQLKGTATTILMVEQNVHVAQALGDDVVVMDDGRVIHAGPMAELAGNRDLQDRMLGLDLAAGGH
jgi:branched-chain amino acid transport system ATP-binding protein